MGQAHRTKAQLLEELKVLDDERRRTQDALQQRDRFNRLLVENSLGLMCSHDLDGVLLSINPAAAHSLGYEPEDGIGHNLREFLAPSVQPLFDAYLERIRHEPSDSGLLRLLARDGSERVWMYRNVRYEEPGVAPCVLGHALDVTERLRAEQALKESEAALRLRDEVLTLATHDLRAPLTNILGRVDIVTMLLQQEATPDTARLMDQLQSLRGATLHMLAVVDEIGDVASLQIGRRLDLQADDVDMAALARAVAAEYGDGTPAARVVVAAPRDAIVVRGDQARLTRVVRNLVDNAVKYSPRDTPVRVGVDRDGAWVVLTVRDRGVGIPKGELPHIFTRFFRASTASGTTGSGLGLAGAKAIVEQHGGTIAVASAAGRGTTITLRLPIAAGSTTTAY
jgi:PAS domain S-box-containing protein